LSACKTAAYWRFFSLKSALQDVADSLNQRATLLFSRLPTYERLRSEIVSAPLRRGAGGGAGLFSPRNFHRK